MTGLTAVLFFVGPILVGLALFYAGWRLAGRPKIGLTVRPTPQTGFQPHIFHGFPTWQWFANIFGWILMIAGGFVLLGALFNLLVIKGSELFY